MNETNLGSAYGPLVTLMGIVATALVGGAAYLTKLGVSYAWHNRPHVVRGFWALPGMVASSLMIGMGVGDTLRPELFPYAIAAGILSCGLGGLAASICYGLWALENPRKEDHQ